jgi:hypothetical protein
MSSSKGKVFEIGDPALRKELFYPAFQFYLADGVTQWPPAK